MCGDNVAVIVQLEVDGLLRVVAVVHDQVEQVAVVLVRIQPLIDRRGQLLVDVAVVQLVVKDEKGLVPAHQVGNIGRRLKDVNIR